MDTSEGPVRIGITRAHLEEDTAKLVHATGPDGRRVSLVDFNRAGVPLMEIVTDPDIRTAEQARRYAEELRLLLRTIDVSDAEMENGQMRVEANVSLRRRGTAAVRDADRGQEHELAAGRGAGDRLRDPSARPLPSTPATPLRQETRGWDDAAGATYVMRVKESSDDYRYFPEPDLPPLHVDPAWLDALRAALPELPSARRARYGALGLSAYDAAVLANDESMTLAFEAIRAAGPDLPAKEVANLVTGDYGHALKESPERNAAGLAGRADAASLAHVLREVLAGRLSRSNAREVVADHVATGRPAAEVIAERGFAQISDVDAVDRLVDDVIAANPAAVADFRAGKPQAVGFLVGQVMKASRGQANAAMVGEALRARLGQGDGA